MSEIKRPEVEAILERAEKATEGPWDQDDDCYVLSSVPVKHPDKIVCDTDQRRSNAPADMDFIAAARENVPALCRWIQELERRLKDAEDTINAMNEGPRE